MNHKEPILADRKSYVIYVCPSLECDFEGLDAEEDLACPECGHPLDWNCGGEDS